MKYKATIKIASDVITAMNSILKLEVGLGDTKDCNTIQSFTAEFDNKYQADIKVCNGSDDSSPWLDAVLFDPNGHEVSCIVADDGSLEGEYGWVIDDDHYVVEIIS